eukprot:COSAG01_NODE_561_length_15460_cov_95.444307_12_plen_38_part_00
MEYSRIGSMEYSRILLKQANLSRPSYPSSLKKIQAQL